MKIKFLLVLSVVYTFSVFGQSARPLFFDAEKDGYYSYRIPSIVATGKGSILAFCAARKGKGGDRDPIDIVMRRSTDSGKTWSQMQVVAHKENSTCDNSEPIVDFRTGELHFLYQIDYVRCYYIKSTDDGQTWSEPVDITYVIEKFKDRYDWNVLAPGPGHGIQMTNGRLVVPFWLSTGGKSHRPSVVVSVFSDDHGQTWQAGDIAIHDNETTVNPNETCCVQLADGSVMFVSRNESPNYRKLATRSPNGATNWSAPVFVDAFFEPICMASMVRYSRQPEQSKNRILFCNPDSRQNPFIEQGASTPRSAKKRSRNNLTVRMSYDEGNTWTVSKVIDTENGGYSDLAVTPDGLIHCLYEGGSRHISIISFTLEWLTDGKDKLVKKDKPLNYHP